MKTKTNLAAVDLRAWWLSHSALMRSIIHALEITAYGSFAVALYLWLRLGQPVGLRQFTVAGVASVLLTLLSVAARKKVAR